MKVIFKGITTENVVRGKSRYTKAVVDYTYNGEPRKQTIVSFSNPTIFKQVQELQPGQEIDVETRKNDAGFSEWASITVAGGGGGATGTPSVSAPTNKVVGSNYETREERAFRQVLIVKQSSLSNAVDSLSVGAKAPPSTEDVLKRAEEYFEWVYQKVVAEDGEEI